LLDRPSAGRLERRIRKRVVTLIADAWGLGWNRLQRLLRRGDEHVDRAERVEWRLLFVRGDGGITFEGEFGLVDIGASCDVGAMFGGHIQTTVMKTTTGSRVRTWTPSPCAGHVGTRTASGASCTG
jgi:hypothetical protein